MNESVSGSGIDHSVERFEGNRTLEFAQQIAQNGINDEGMRTALAYSPEEDAAMGEFKKIGHDLEDLAKAKGMQVTVEEDTFGNCYATLRGQEFKTLAGKKIDKEILLGSHVDSVMDDSEHDGTFGIGIGLETLRRFIDKGIVPKHSLRVAAFRAQKSAITKRAFLGSALASGKVGIKALNEFPYRCPTFSGSDGKSLFEVVRKKRGLTKDQFIDAVKNPFLKDKQLKAAIEVHIGNGDTLENRNQPCVIVSAIGGSRRREIDIDGVVVEKSKLANPEKYRTMRMLIRGKSRHSGATPMSGEIIDGMEFKRSDALAAISKFLQEYEYNHVVNFGVLDGAYNMIPGQAFVDLRVPKEEGRGTKDIVETMKTYLPEDTELDVSFLEDKGEVNFIREKVVLAVTGIVLMYEKGAEKLAKENGGLFRATVGDLEVDKKLGKISMLTDERMLSELFGTRFAQDIDASILAIRDVLEKTLGGAGVSLKMAKYRKGDIVSMDYGMIKCIAEQTFADMAVVEDAEDVQLGDEWSMPGYDIGTLEAPEKLLLLARTKNGLVEAADADTIADLLFNVIMRFFAQKELA